MQTKVKFKNKNKNKMKKFKIKKINMKEWFIKIYRKIWEWEWYWDNTTRSLFIHLLIFANHKKNLRKWIEIERWQIIIGRKELSKILWLWEQSIRTWLNKLKSTNEITIKTTNKYSVITLCNYDLYIDTNQQDNQQLTNNQPTTNQQLTTNKNEKNIKNEKKENIDTSIFWKIEKFQKIRSAKTLWKVYIQLFEKITNQKVVETDQLFRKLWDVMKTITSQDFEKILIKFQKISEFVRKYEKYVFVGYKSLYTYDLEKILDKINLFLLNEKDLIKKIQNNEFWNNKLLQERNNQNKFQKKEENQEKIIGGNSPPTKVRTNITKDIVLDRKKKLIGEKNI